MINLRKIDYLSKEAQNVVYCKQVAIESNPYNGAVTKLHFDIKIKANPYKL